MARWSSVSFSSSTIAGYRYYRLSISAVNGSTICGFNEIEFFKSSGAKVEMPLSNASANSIYDGSYSANNAVNGIFNDTYGWATGAGQVPSWWKIDMSMTIPTPAFYRIYSRGPASETQAPKDFILEGSHDNVSWTTLDTPHQ